MFLTKESKSPKIIDTIATIKIIFNPTFTKYLDPKLLFEIYLSQTNIKKKLTIGINITTFWIFIFTGTPSNLLFFPKTQGTVLCLKSLPVRNEGNQKASP